MLIFLFIWKKSTDTLLRQVVAACISLRQSGVQITVWAPFFYVMSIFEFWIKLIVV